MVYSVVVCGSLVTEQFAFRGKIYTKSYETTPDGLTSKDKSFAEQLAKNKVENYICEKIDSILDKSSLTSELQRLEAEGIEKNM